MALRSKSNQSDNFLTFRKKETRVFKVPNKILEH